MPRGRAPCSLIPLTDSFHSSDGAVRNREVVRPGRPEPPRPGRRPRLADLVDTVRVESDVILDLRHRFERGLIGPHRIEGALAASRDAVVGSVTLVGAIRR